MVSAGMWSRISREQITLAVFGIFAVAVACWTPFDEPAKMSVDEGLRRALATFAAARGFEAVISLFQSATVSTGFLIGGISVQPAAVLAPARELVEHFSSVLLVASASFALQKLLLSITSSAATSLITIGLCAAWLFACILRWRAASLLRGVVLALIALRLLVPLSVVLSTGIYQSVLAGEYQLSHAALAESSPDTGIETSGGSWERIKRGFGRAVDIPSKIEEIRTRVSVMAEHIVRLTAVFVLQTVLLPLVWLACAVCAWRQFARWASNALVLPRRSSDVDYRARADSLPKVEGIVTPL